MQKHWNNVEGLNYLYWNYIFDVDCLDKILQSWQVYFSVFQQEL